MAEVQGILESRKYVIDSNDTTGVTYRGLCEWDTFERLTARGKDPYDAPIWSIELIQENGNISEKKLPYDDTEKKFLKQGKLRWTQRTAYTYL